MAGKKKVKYSNTSIATEQMKPTVCPERRWQIWLAAGIIIAAGIIVYFNSFDGVFLYDDNPSIVENPHIRKLWPLSEAMSVPLANRGATVSGRPILSLSFAINYALFGKEPWGYHLVNLAIHIFAGLLLFGVVRRTLSLEQFRERYRKQAIWPALAVALLWVVHPLQTESVTYIVQRAESMMGMFFLLTLYCAVRGFQSKRAYFWYIASVFVCALGMGTKEVMVAAPMIVLLYDYVFISGSLKNLVRRRWVLYGALAASWIIPVTQILLTRKMISMDLQTIDPLKYALTQPGVILYYLKLSIWPSPLVMDYNWPTADSITGVFPAGFVILSMLVLTGWGLIRRRWFGFVGAWFFFILAPSSSFVPTAQNLHVHRMYLSLAAIIIPVVAVGKHLLQKMLAGRLDNRRLGVVGAGFVLVITAILGSLTYERNKAYQSAYALWSDNVENRPESKIAHYNFGLMLEEEGKVEQAKAEYEHAIRIDPNDTDAHNNLGNVLMQQGKLNEAMAQYKQVLRLDPDYANALYNLGNVLMQQGKLKQAQAQYEYALSINPNHSGTHHNLGVAFMREGNIQRAKTQFENVLRINPEDTNAHNSLGNVFLKLGELDLAKAQYEYALSIDPNDADSHNNLGNILMQQGKLNEAMAQYKQVLRLDPDYANAHYNLGTVLMQQGKLKQAQAQYEYALSINPNHSDTHHNLGVAFMREGNIQRAKTQFKNVLRINPEDTDAHNNLGEVLMRQGKPFQAAAHYEKVLVIDPNNTIAMNNLAWLLATCPDDNFRNGKRAVELAERACKVTDYKIPELLDTLAAAYAEEKRFTEAIETANKALNLAKYQNNEPVYIEQIQLHLEQYKQGKPFRNKP